jgi:hypothetical protein
MYAMARNAAKHADRDRRPDKTQEIEYDFLAPDSINEIFDGLLLMKQFVARAYNQKNKKTIADIPENNTALTKQGENILLQNAAEVAKLEILAEGFENSHRKVQLIKVPEACTLFKELIIYYGVVQLIIFIESKKITSWKKLTESLPSNPVRNQWKNIGGQLIPEDAVNTLIGNIRSGKVKSWEEVHIFYNRKSKLYPSEKFQHAYASLLEVLKLTPQKFKKKIFISLLEQSVITKEWMSKGIYNSRAKDYSNDFRKMMYDTEEEMNKVLGRLDENSFIQQQNIEAAEFENKVKNLIQVFQI